MISIERILRGDTFPVGAFRRNARGFTLLELLTVLGMIMLITGAMTASIGSAHERARIQKAKADVKSVTQAVLGYENHVKDYKLEQMEDVQISKSTKARFLFGAGETSETGEQIPVILQASLTRDGVMLDPWGTPYTISIRQGQARINDTSATSAKKTSFVVPNFYCLSVKERQ